MASSFPDHEVIFFTPAQQHGQLFNARIHYLQHQLANCLNLFQLW